jgi:hypothetical protein
MLFGKKKPQEKTKIALIQFGYGKYKLYTVTLNGKSLPETNTMYKEEADRHYAMIAASLKGEQQNLTILKEETF